MVNLAAKIIVTRQIFYYTLPNDAITSIIMENANKEQQARTPGQKEATHPVGTEYAI